LTQQSFEYCSKNSSVLSKDFVPILFDKLSYASICQIVPPKELKAIKNFHTKEGISGLNIL